MIRDPGESRRTGTPSDSGGNIFAPFINNQVLKEWNRLFSECLGSWNAVLVYYRIDIVWKYLDKIMGRGVTLVKQGIMSQSGANLLRQAKLR